MRDSSASMRAVLWVLPMATLLCSGCRTVWMHPEASPAKFAEDKAWCERAVADPSVAGVAYRNWKACLEANGWTSVADFRFGAAVRKPMSKAKPKGPRGRL